MNKILKESKEDTDRFKKELIDAIMNTIKSIKIDFSK